MFEKTQTKTTRASKFTVDLETGKAFVYSKEDGKIDIEMDTKDSKVVSLIDYITAILDDNGYISTDVATDKAEFVALVNVKEATSEELVAEK